MAGIVRRIIQTLAAPKSVGPFRSFSQCGRHEVIGGHSIQSAIFLCNSQAVVADRTMYISGQMAFEPSTMEFVKGGTAAQAEQTLKNIGAILEAEGANYNNVVKTTVLLQNIADLGDVNAVFAKYFPVDKPTRTAFQVAALPMGALVEIEAIAVLGKITD